MKRFHFSLLAALVASLASISPAQLVINEIFTAESGTDDEEFIELYDGGALTPLANLQLRLINGANGVAYTTIDLTNGGLITNMPVDGFLVIGSSLVPSRDITFGLASNNIQNGDPDAAIIFRTTDSATLDAVSYFTQYDTVPGTAENLSLTASQYEGAGGAGAGGDDTHNQQTGTAASAAFILTSIGRFPDGNDTNDNQTDIRVLYGGKTPGASNATPYFATASEDFSTATGLSRIWARSFVDVVLETAATAVPAAIPNSPDSATPDQWGSLKDNTGGGTEALIANVLAEDYTVTGYFYCGPISTTVDPDTEVGALMARVNGNGFQNNNTADGVYDISAPINVYGNSHYALEMDYRTGNVSAIKVLNSVRTVLATTSTPLTVGWHLLGIRVENDEVQFGVNGSTLHLLTGEVARAGYVGIGYREVQAVGAGTVRNNFDAINVTAPVPVPVELSGFDLM